MSKQVKKTKPVVSRSKKKVADKKVERKVSANDPARIYGELSDDPQEIECENFFSDLQKKGIPFLAIVEHPETKRTQVLVNGAVLQVVEMHGTITNTVGEFLEGRFNENIKAQLQAAANH